MPGTRAQPQVTVIGAGLVGALLATLLAQRGFRVDLFERRSDPRRSGHAGGRSINLALAERGLHGLRLAGLADAVLAQGVMMRGRFVHPLGEVAKLQRYGRDDSEVIWSVHRGRLNLTLLDAAEAAGARIHFDQKLAAADFAQGALFFHDERSGGNRRWDCDSAVGADGAGSELRRAMALVEPLAERFEALGHGYKELAIPAGPEGAFRLERNALHIWPRGSFMCIALPNADGSFTVTLFLPNEGAPSFASLVSIDAVRRFFDTQFRDAAALVPDLLDDFMGNPTGLLGTLYLDHWRIDGKALLIGDAAHAIVPFHGQGMNCGFEDAVELAGLMQEQPDDRSAVFAELERRRKPNADAIARMALENYIEMRDRVDDADYLLQKQLERVLAERHPDQFVPRYSMVSFTRMPYATAMQRGAIQQRILGEFTQGHARIEEVDVEAASRAVLRELSRL